MAAQTVSLGRRPGSRDRNSIPILVVRLGLSRDFLVAIGLFFLVIGVAALVAFVAFG